MFDYVNPFFAASRGAEPAQGGISKASFLKALSKVGQRLLGLEKDQATLRDEVANLKAAVEALATVKSQHPDPNTKVGVLGEGETAIEIPWSGISPGAEVYRKLYGEPEDDRFAVLPEPIDVENGNDDKAVHEVRKMIHASLMFQGVAAAADGDDKTLKQTQSQLLQFAAHLEGAD